ncbi:MAG: hypothetical protein HY815_21045 [Candidatus Riflebacteria bacterium]|nr:hypothetical protein [Candidatus Riflebacteria bacterium]
MRAISTALLVLALVCPAWASPQLSSTVWALQIDGMEPMTARDLAGFSSFAVRLSEASRTDPRVRPSLEEVLSQTDRGIVKRAIAYMALSHMGQEDAARSLIGAGFRDQAVLKIVGACQKMQDSITMVPTR